MGGGLTGIAVLYSVCAYTMIDMNHRKSVASSVGYLF